MISRSRHWEPGLHQRSEDLLMTRHSGKLSLPSHNDVSFS